MKVLTAIFSIVAASQLPALTIKIDYTYDTNNFFDTAEKRVAIEAAAKFFGDLLNDHLLEINQNTFVAPFAVSWNATLTHPGTAANQVIPGLIVPEDTIIIFVGGRSLPGSTLGQGGPGGYSASGNQSWFDRIAARGNSGALADPPTDFARWGGAVTFDTDANWNFSLTSNGSGFEFIPVALHEIGHVLGIGTSPVWSNLTSSGFFDAPAANQSWGASPPAFNGHLQNPIGGALNSPLFNSFQVSHGLQRPALMLPSSTDTGSNFDVATDLDLSVLFDLGWDVFPRTPLNFASLKPSDVSVNWPSTSFLDYRIERSSDNFPSFTTAKTLAGGTGFVQVWSDPSPPPTRAFYRLYSEYNVSHSSPVIVFPFAKQSTGGEEFTTISVDPIMVDCKNTEHQSTVGKEDHTHEDCDHASHK